MIGTRLKGFRHLLRLAKTSSEVGFFFKHDHFSINYGVALYVKAEEFACPYLTTSGDYVIMFNNCLSNVKYNDSYHTGDGINKRIRELRGNYAYVWISPIDKNRYRDESSLFAYPMTVPEDFDKKYKEFCEANKKQIPNLTRFTDINSPIARYFFAITNGSKNFFFWAINAYFKQGISPFLLERIMLWNDNYSQLSNKLAKGTITGYTSGHDFFVLSKELMNLRRNKRANDVISMFNTAQKKALKAYSLSIRDYDTLSKFGKLSSKKKNNFIRKMSTIEDPVEILKQMSFLADVHFEWKKESLMEFLKNSENFNCEVVIDKGDIVLLKVKDYETVKRLAKTTNWCISKDKKYWIEYVETKRNATQYVLMDFSRKEDDNLSIVGFTSVHDRGITNAHDFQNRNLMQGRRTSTVSEIKSFVSKFVDCSSIYGVLDKYGIKMSDVVTYEPNQYKWDRESMFKYLEECVSPEDYYIIHDDGERVVLIVEDDNVRYFLGDAYIGQRGNRGIGPDSNQHIIFADFSKKQNDPEKLTFGVITHNFADHESSCARLYNDRFEPVTQSFDSKLEEYGLPYDIICRNDDVVERFYNSLSSLELAAAKDLLNDKNVRRSLLDRDRSDYVRDCITNVTFGYNSADYIKMFYERGYKLSDVIGGRHTGDLARRMMQNMLDTRLALPGGNAIVPSDEDLQALVDGKIEDYNTSFYIGNFMMLMMILDNETNTDFFIRIAGYIHDRHYVCDMFDLVCTRICDTININDYFDVAKYIVSYAFNFGSPRVINVINSKKITNDRLYDFINGTKKRTVTTTEMWVRNANGRYVLETANVEEAAAHAPRRR